MPTAFTQLPATVLHDQLTTAGIPVISVSGSEAPFIVTYDPSASQAQIDQGNAIVAAFDGQSRKPRILLDIYNDILALSASQKNNIGNDLFSAAHKWSIDIGFNRSGIFVIYAIIQQAGLTAANMNLFKAAGAAMYAQDNPYYLVNPAFDPTINVAGDQPV